MKTGFPNTTPTTLTVTNWNGTHAGTVVFVPVTGKDWQVQSEGEVIGAVRWDAAGQEWTGTANHTYPRTGGAIIADSDLNYILADLLEQFRGLRSSEFWISTPPIPVPETEDEPDPNCLAFHSGHDLLVTEKCYRTFDVEAISKDGIVYRDLTEEDTEEVTLWCRTCQQEVQDFDIDYDRSYI